jgi:transposase
MELNFDYKKVRATELLSFTRRELTHSVLQLSERVVSLESTVADLQGQIDKNKVKEVNLTANQPSSKQPEFAKDTGSPTDEEDPKKKKKKRKKKRGKRNGSGNRAKPTPSKTNHNSLDFCPECSTPLMDQPVIEEPSRIVEDIPEPPKTTIVTEEVVEKKWCPECKDVVSSKTEAALPKSDIGLNALILIAYLWVIPAMSLPGIQRYLQQFFSMTLSTSGLSKMMIRLSEILSPIRDEILEDVKGGRIIFADETGWKIKGVLHWMWAFANERSAFYWVDRGRGSAVVEAILGNFFAGILVTDAWCAYYKIVCSKQACMAHIFRKVRKFNEAYPHLRSLLKFKRKLRRIIQDGVNLQALKSELDSDVFERRLGFLKVRLETLLAWPNPNLILAEIIAKVERQKENILTFVEHEGVPTTNNYGEFIIKKGVLKRKVSGGSMSLAGANAFCVLVSIALTCQLRKISFRDFLKQSLLQYIRTGSPMLLSEYEAQMNLNQPSIKMVA